jgi:hypothetical protein
MRDNGYGGRRYLSAPSIPVPQRKRVRKGHCRYCGCTANRACILTRSLFPGHAPQTCSWADASKTLCTAPKCLRADIRDKRAAAKARK